MVAGCARNLEGWQTVAGGRSQVLEDRQTDHCVRMSQPEGLADSSRWSFPAVLGNDHRKTEANSDCTPEGCQNRRLPGLVLIGRGCGRRTHRSATPPGSDEFLGRSPEVSAGSDLRLLSANP